MRVLGRAPPVRFMLTGFPLVKTCAPTPLCAAVCGTDDRAGADELLGSAQVAALVADQHMAVTAVHAFSVERSVP